MNLKEIAEFVNFISLTVGVVLAIYGINAWRREAEWKRDSEVCQEVLELSYEVRDLIDYIRTPSGQQGEGETRKPEESESENLRQIKNAVWRTIERYNKHSEKFSRLWRLNYRFLVCFVRNESNPIENLQCVINDIKNAVYNLLDHWSKYDGYTIDERQDEKHTVFQNKYENIIWRGNSVDLYKNGIAGPDEIQKKVNDAILLIEEKYKALHRQNCIG